MRWALQESRAAEKHLSYVQTLSVIKNSAGLTSVVETVDRQKAIIRLLSNSGHLVGSTSIEWNKWCYQIHVIKVSKPNLGRGYGRLLQMEAAVYVIARGVSYKSPFYFFTPDGKQAFGFYPLSARSILKEKLPKAVNELKKAADVPWQEPFELKAQLR